MVHAVSARTSLLACVLLSTVFSPSIHAFRLSSKRLAAKRRSDASSRPQNDASDAVELAVGIAAYHDVNALAAYRTTLARLLRFLVAMDAPIDTVMSFGKGVVWTRLEGYVGQNDLDSLLAIASDGNMREVGAALFVPMEFQYLVDVYLHALCRISAKDISTCNVGSYSELEVDGLGKLERHAPSDVPAIPKSLHIPSTSVNAFRECPPNERSADGTPLGLCVTRECILAGSCPCKFPRPLPREPHAEWLRIYEAMGGEDQIGLDILVDRYKEVCGSMPKQYRNPFTAMLYKYTLLRPGRGYLATARVGDKVKHLDGVSDEKLMAMQARHKSGASDIKTGWTKAELDALSVGLSKREWEYQNVRAPLEPTDRLDWNIGAKAWVANYDGKIAHVDGEITGRENYAKSRWDMGLRVMNSPSGTTDQTLQIGQFMGLRPGSLALHDLRLACMGYMLWAEHHSYDEMGVVGLPYRLKYDSKDPFNFDTLLGSKTRGAAFLQVARAVLRDLATHASDIGGETLSTYNFKNALTYFDTRTSGVER